MKEISVEEFYKMRQERADFQLIDVREPYEYEESNLGGLLIPLSDLEDSTELIAKDKTVIVHCRSGVRSAQAIFFLEKLGFENLFNLSGGIMAYAQKYGLE